MPEKILIVDDDLETLRLIGMMLQRQGYDIAAANNGAQAITMTRNERPDLIVLDIMMPDMDGYKVTQELRRDPQVGDTPILMFTAKSQVDDKVAGYDSGADDYLTKPVHPAELVAHIKALLSRTRAKPLTETHARTGFMVGIVGCKGGLGVSTLALNLAVSYAQLGKKDVIAAEIRPGQGTWAIELGISQQDGLSKLLSRNSFEITAPIVDNQLTGTSYGIRLLIASSRSNDVAFSGLQEKLEAVASSLAAMPSVVFLDIGTPLLPGFEKICNQCQEILVVTDSTPAVAKRTKTLIDDIHSTASTVGKTIDVVLVNRVRSDMQLSAEQVSEMIPGNPVKGMIPASPEQVYQAFQKQIPVYKIQSDGFLSQQIDELVKMINTRVNK